MRSPRRSSRLWLATALFGGFAVLGSVAAFSSSTPPSRERSSATAGVTKPAAYDPEGDVARAKKLKVLAVSTLDEAIQLLRRPPFASRRR